MKLTDYIKYQSLPLPTDIGLEVSSGHWDTAREMIRRRLAVEAVPECIKKRLELQLIMLDDMPNNYTVSQEKLLAQIREAIPEFTSEELENAILDGKLDYIYIDGQKMFLRSSFMMLMKVYPQYWERTQEGDRAKPDLLNEIIESVKDGDKFGAHVHIQHTLELKPEDDVIGQTARVHLPVSWATNPRVNNFRIISSEPAFIKQASDDAVHHTVYFEGKAEKGAKFSVEYEYDYIDTYRDMYNMDPALCNAAPAKEIAEKYLAEEQPHINFSPMLRALKDEIIGDETNQLLKARRIYNYVTQRCRYRFTRNYTSYDSVAEDIAKNGRGDCGVQALLFITLCRLAGVPAMWESGTTAEPGDVGMHDWALFYIEGIGWRHADCSFGGSAFIRGAEKRRQFYFGNIDPYRNPMNRGICAEFEPEKKFWRFDSCDSQVGEVEFETRGAKRSEFSVDMDDKGIKRIL